MKSKRNIIIFAIIGIVLLVPILYLIDKNDSKYIEIWAEGKELEIISQKVSEYEKVDKNVRVILKDVTKEGIVNKLNKTAKEEWPNLTIINDRELFYIEENYGVSKLNDSIVINNIKYFSDSTISRVKYNDKYKGIPLTSTPMAMFLQKNILIKYGYELENIDTWEELINIGVNIFNKTNGTIRLFNDKDISNIKKILINQLMSKKEKSEEEIINDIDMFIKLVYDKELVGSYGENNYICRIASVDFINDIQEMENDSWVCNKVPSIGRGESRFIDVGGENLVVLNTMANETSIADLCAYLIKESNYTLKDIYDKSVFPASKAVYRIGKIDEKMHGIDGESPIVIFTNITQRALRNNNHELINKLYKHYNIND